MKMLCDHLSRRPLWKAAGVDKVHGYWWKTLTSLHANMCVALNAMIRGELSVPTWMVTCWTILVPKTERAMANPASYRPVTCLPVIYKIFTGLIAELMWHHIENYGILPVEQRGCVPGSLGCREQLLIDHMILHNARTRQRNLSMAYIDFRKAYDSVSHGWIFAMLEIFKFHKNIVNTLRRCMAQWQTRMHVTSKYEIKFDDLASVHG